MNQIKKNHTAPRLSGHPSRVFKKNNTTTTVLTRRDPWEAYLLVNELELHGVGHGVHVDGHLAHAPGLVLHQHGALCFRRDPEHSTRAQRRLGRDGPTRQEREKKRLLFFVFLLCWFVLRTAGQHRVSWVYPLGETTDVQGNTF